jgi:L-aspartate oxidase
MKCNLKFLNLRYKRSPQILAGGVPILNIGGWLAGLFCAPRLALRAVTIFAAAPIGQRASSVLRQGRMT